MSTPTTPLKRDFTAMFSAFAGADNDITYPTLMGFYRQTDPTLNNRGANIHLYHQILLDPHAYSVLQKRASAINAYPLELKPGGKTAKDKKACALVTEQLANMRLRQIREEMLLSELVYGFQVGEAMWSRDGDTVVLTDVLARDQIRFNMDDQYCIRLRTRTNMLLGDLVPERKFVWSTFDRRNNGPYGRGLGAVLWWPVHFKRMLQEFWLEYADKFTTPAVVGTSPAGATPEMQQRVLIAAESIATGSKAASLPDGCTLDTLESKRAAAEMVYSSFIEYLDEEISKAVLGESATSGSATHSSKAATQVHSDLHKILAVSDSTRIDAALNSGPIKWLTEYNVPGAKPPRLETDTSEPADLKKAAEIVAVLASAGWKRKREWIEQTFGGEFEECEPGTAAENPTAAGSTQVNVNAAAEA